MAVIHLTSEEFAARIEEMLDLANKGGKVFIHYEENLYTITPVSDEELENSTKNERAFDKGFRR